MFRAGTAFTAWTIFSFLCHYAAKQFLSEGEGNRLVLAALLTSAQLTCCYILLTHSTRSSTETGIVPGEKDTSSATKRWAYVMAALTHVGATFSTNYSLAVLYAPSTLTIKLMEPLMSAFVVWLVLGRPIKPVTFLALCVLIAGSLGFVGNPLASMSLGGGTALALISNVLYGLRNVLIKHFLHTNMSLCEGYEYIVYAAVTAASLYVCGNGNIQEMLLVMLMLSAVCHVIYSYISTNVILHELSVVGHAVANISKRLLVVLLMVAAGQKQLESAK